MSQATKQAQKQNFLYDTSNVAWRDFITPGTYYKMLNVDLEAKQADMLVKFDAKSQCMYHRHVATTTTLVLEGELVVREQGEDGKEVIKVKPAGSYSIGGEDEIHIEGSGDEPCIIFFSMRTKGDDIYQLLNNDLTLKKNITVADFYRDWHEKWPNEFK